MNVNFNGNGNKEFKSMIQKNGFQQLIKMSTRITNTSSTLIDIILSNNTKNIATSFTSAQSLSDHDTICCVRKLNSHRFNPRTITCRNFRAYDPNALKQDLLSTDLSPLYNMKDVNQAWKFLKNILTESFNRHAPIITKHVKGSLYPWLTPEVLRTL